MPSQSATLSSPSGRPNGFLTRSAIVAAIGGLLFGFDTVVISGTTQAARQVFALPGWIPSITGFLSRWFGALNATEAMVGVYVFSGLVGTIIGAAVGGELADKLGRRLSLRILAVIYLASALGCAFAWDWTSLLAFRVLAGLGIGGSSVIGPMYITEVSPAAWRGRLVGLFQFNIVTGILVAYLSNYLVGQGGFGGSEWRIKLGVAALPALAFLALLFTIPRSPRWLVMHGHEQEAREVLRLTGEPNYEEEVRQIAADVAENRKKTSEPLFCAKYKLPIFLAITIGLFNQLTGINALLYYADDIFRAAGFQNPSAPPVLLGFTNFVLTIVALSLIDRLGRKKLLLTGAAGCSACLAGAGFIYLRFLSAGAHLQSAGGASGVLLACLLAFIGFFAFSQGAVIWVYLGEVFPNAVRGKGQSLGSFSHWIMNAVIQLSFPIVVARFGGPGYAFVFFAAMTLLQLLVVLTMYPETSGVPLEELQARMGAG
ncbi:MAG: sugar porter family MFS transporter [Acidobacteria bacterium]|nr:sugar porter family MFS transporter [Acidobacteriota bacterium]